jgi:hypothetical protein
MPEHRRGAAGARGTVGGGPRHGAPEADRLLALPLEISRLDDGTLTESGVSFVRRRAAAVSTRRRRRNRQGGE